MLRRVTPANVTLAIQQNMAVACAMTVVSSSFNGDCLQCEFPGENSALPCALAKPCCNLSRTSVPFKLTRQTHKKKLQALQSSTYGSSSATLQLSFTLEMLCSCEYKPPSWKNLRVDFVTFEDLSQVQCLVYAWMPVSSWLTGTPL